MSRMRVARNVIVWALAATVAACGLTVLGGPTEATDAGATDAAGEATHDMDAPVTPPDGDAVQDASADADADASRSEDASPVDAGPDARDAAPPVTTFCTSSTATFCADFDAPSDAGAIMGWTAVMPGGGGSIAAVTAPPTSHSSPRSLHAIATGGNASILRKNVTVNSSLRVDFWVRFSNLPSGNGVISPIRLTPPNPPGEDFYFFVSTTKSYFQEYNNHYSPMLPGMTEDAWHHVVIELTTTTSRIDATVDGTPYWTNNLYPYAWPPPPTTATIDIGAAALYMTNGADVWIDDIVIIAQ